MTPEIEKQIAQLIDSARHAGSDVASFFIQQAPDVVRQILLWKKIEAASIAATFLCVSCLFTWGGCRIMGKYRKGEYNDDGIPYWMLFAAALIFLIFSFTAIMEFVKIQVSPKLVILDYISDVASKTK